MIKTFDKYIFFRMLLTSSFVVGLLIFIFIIIDFSENSGEFTDRGASLSEIWYDYYLNYIPEMIRLVSPVAVFAACLWLTGQMANRLEIIALRAAGISLYRLLAPYMVFAILVAATISYLDGYVVPRSNAIRAEFEQKYIMNRTERLDRNRIFRQESPDRLMLVNYFDIRQKTGYRVTFYTFDDDKLTETMEVGRISWQDSTEKWRLVNGTIKKFNDRGYEEISFDERDTTLNLYPRDFGRTSSDVYQLTYPEIRDYLESIERSGAGGIDMPKVQYYGKLSYPFSIILVTIIGVAVASVRRKGGRGVHIAVGLVISFLYLALMKLFEPFGYTGAMDPMHAAIAPHGIFFIVALFLLFSARK
ncbi:LptF/LptG family permease [Natronogracilivirga saccharolytica]|uniref:LptF/LptG family permease n=1 Tax=Natronogracilivirga saccharolytica TaxID=2812953 RepID=A0A8J7RKT8_9BACT|nr:LptF/LptG family permease [Natronogracilivirga saccharolytica]MBP3193117.1 LptF/LptG family permease [Natronogracilivirga saccharolytica]